MVSESNRRVSPLKGKGGLVMVGVVAVMLLWIWLDRRYGAPKEPTAEPTVGEFVGLRRPDFVTGVEVRGTSNPFKLQKRGEEWRVGAPISAPAAKQTVDDAVSALLGASVKYRSTRVPTGELKQYGLDHPAAEIVLTDGGKHVVQVGTKAPQSMGLYAMDTDDRRVFAVAESTLNAFTSKKGEDFRDKSALGFGDTEKVQRVGIVDSKGQVDVERRSAADWALTRPISAPADGVEVSSLLSQAKDLKADSFIAGGASDLARYGLSNPQLTFTVTDDQGSHALLLGAEAKDKAGKLYALRRGEADVMLLEKNALTTLDKGVPELHARKLLEFDTTKAQKVSGQTTAGSWEIVKRGSDWWLTKPVNMKADATHSSSLLTSLTTPALRFVEEHPSDLGKYGLQNPPVQVTVEVEGQPTMRLLIGSATPSKGKTYYAKTGGSPAVYEVSSYVFDDLNLKPDQLKGK